jgi:hypothetical protein
MLETFDPATSSFGCRFSRPFPRRRRYNDPELSQNFGMDFIKIPVDPMIPDQL